MVVISIGIQSRLGSSRLPEKSIYEIDGRPTITHLLNRVSNAINWIERKTDRYQIYFNVYLLVPESESDFWNEFVFQYNVHSYQSVSVIKGDMDNVFSRYEKMFSEYKPSYVVRLTGDCPFIPPPVLSKMINISIRDQCDYISNVDPRFRTMADGYDVEVISNKAFRWLRDSIDRESKHHLEHVTTYLRQESPEWMRLATMTTNIDQSDVKYSIDTFEDYKQIKKAYTDKTIKDGLAKKMGFGVYEY